MQKLLYLIEKELDSLIVEFQRYCLQERNVARQKIFVTKIQIVLDQSIDMIVWQDKNYPFGKEIQEILDIWVYWPKIRMWRSSGNLHKDIGLLKFSIKILRVWISWMRTLLPAFWLITRMIYCSPFFSKKVLFVGDWLEQV